MDQPDESQEWLRPGQYAKLRGMPRQTVYSATNNKRIHVREDGRINVAEADRYWARASAVGRGNDPNGEDGGGNVTDLTLARTRKTMAEAELAEMQVAQERAELVRVSDVKLLWHDAARTLRERLLGVPMQVAPMLAGRTPAEIRTVLSEAIRRALRELPDDPPGLPEAQ